MAKPKNCVWKSVEAIEYEYIYSERKGEGFVKATVYYNEIDNDEFWWSPDKLKPRHFWDKYVAQIVGDEEFDKKDYGSFDSGEFEDEWHSWPTPNRVKVCKTEHPITKRVFTNIMDVEHFETEDDELLAEVDFV